MTDYTPFSANATAQGGTACVHLLIPEHKYAIGEMVYIYIPTEYPCYRQALVVDYSIFTDDYYVLYIDASDLVFGSNPPTTDPANLLEHKYVAIKQQYITGIEEDIIRIASLNKTYLSDDYKNHEVQKEQIFKTIGPLQPYLKKVAGYLKRSHIGKTIYFI